MLGLDITRHPRSPCQRTDGLPLAQRKTNYSKPILLQNSEARDSKKNIEQMFENRITAAFDERTNSLIVRAKEALHQQIESLLIQLDEAPDRATQVGGVTGLTSSDASKPPMAIAEFRRRLANLETPVMQLAEKVRAVETSLSKDHRMVPSVMVKHGERTLALTVGPATIVPDNTPHAIDRTFLEFYNRDDVPTEYSQELEFPDLRAYEAKESLTKFQLENPVTLELSDQLSAIINHGQSDFKVKTDAARVTAVEQSTIWELPSHNLTREFSGLIQIDQRLPEGTPLFKNGELAGITLLGTRFMKDDVPGSYVVPANRIFEVLRQVKTE